MTAASLVFPPGRALAGWWHRLAPLGPRAVWVGHLLLHHVEALVAVESLQPLDPFSQFVLKALTLQGPGPSAALHQLESRLHLSRQAIHQALRRLQADGLAEPDAQRGWRPTELGRQGLDQGSYFYASQERRAFHFLEGRPPHYLNLKTAACTTWQPAGEWVFDPAILQACLSQPPAWKERHGFPAGVREVLGLSDWGEPLSANHHAVSASWQRVIVDRPERLAVVLLLVAGEKEGERLLGFAVRPETWELLAEPALCLNTDWQTVVPDLTEEPPLAAWEQVWRAWCQPRGLPAAEVEACSLKREGCRLRVAAPHRLVQRLRAERSDVLKGEAWLLAGAGRLRVAARVEVAELGDTSPKHP